MRRTKQKRFHGYDRRYWSKDKVSLGLEPAGTPCYILLLGQFISLIRLGARGMLINPWIKQVQEFVRMRIGG
jgi:hypothetical protein